MKSITPFPRGVALPTPGMLSPLRWVPHAVPWNILGVPFKLPPFTFSGRFLVVRTSRDEILLDTATRYPLFPILRPFPIQYTSSLHFAQLPGSHPSFFTLPPFILHHPSFCTLLPSFCTPPPPVLGVSQLPPWEPPRDMGRISLHYGSNVRATRRELVLAHYDGGIRSHPFLLDP
jgi:hypothetical protein